MKIKTKLTLLFSLVIAILLLVVNLYIYSLSKKYASVDFFKRLQERALATANVFLEEDEVSKKIFLDFQKKYLEKLPGETIRVYDLKNKPAFINDSLPNYFPNSIINKTRKENIYQHKENNQYVYGIYYLDNQGNFVILVTAYDKIGDAKLKQLRDVLTIGFFFSIIIVFFIGRFFIKQMLIPLREINKQVTNFTENNLHLRLQEGNKKDEITELAINFNGMLGRIENAFELQKNFVANASHELRTPLTSIIGNIELAMSRPRTSNDYQLFFKTILEEAERLQKLSDGLLNIAQASSDINFLKMESFRIDELLEEAINIVHDQMPESKMGLVFNNMPPDSDELIINGNKSLLMIAFENIFENANKFSDNQKVIIQLNNFIAKIEVIIRDSGIGIPENDILKIFQPFSRGENARTFSGSGIGLSLSQKIFLIHKCDLSIQSEEGKGTVVTVIFQKSTSKKS